MALKWRLQRCIIQKLFYFKSHSFSLLIYSNIIILLLISGIRIKSGLKWSNRFGDFFLLTALSQLLQSKQNNSYKKLI